MEKWRALAVAKETELQARRRQKLEELRQYVQHRITTRINDSEYRPRIQVSTKKNHNK